MSAKDVALVYGVPSQLIGIPDAQTYSNFAEAKLALYNMLEKGNNLGKIDMDSIVKKVGANRRVDIRKISTENIAAAYDGAVWPARLIGFGVGIILFSILTWLILGEKIEIKSAVCVLLAFCILIIQLFWK